MTCAVCGTALSPTAKFCHKCGARRGTPVAGGWQVALPWGLAGAAVGALVAVLAMQGWSRERGSAAPSDPAAAAGGSPSPALRAPDISQMSPEERATRLFNRVEELAEAGKQDSVQFFLPM